ncbi:glycosyltransferase family 4 protein [Azospirillum sp. sgz302134]
MSLDAKICLSTQEYPPHVGGVAIAARRLARLLVAAGCQVHVVTPCDTAGATGEVRTDVEDGVTVHRLYHDFSNPQAAFAFRQLVRDLDGRVGFDLFHGFFLTAVYPCTTVAGRRPVIASVRGNDALTLIDHPYTRATILSGLRKATWITSVNELYLQRVAREVPVEGRSSVIRNGVAPVPEAAEPWRLTDANRGVVGTVGQLRRVKDLPLLVRGYAAVPAELRCRLVMAGYFHDRDEEEWTHTLVREFGLEAEVVVTGHFPQTEVFGHLRGMHCYVQSSAFEGLPNALMEAACLGLPLVATAVGGMREVLDDGDTALLVPHGDPAAMAQAIARVLSDDALAAHLSTGARKLAARLSPDKERDEWLGLYGRLLAA